eukprot:739487-Amorphochlora_amoeboformis.AAC.1
MIRASSFANSEADLVSRDIAFHCSFDVIRRVRELLIWVILVIESYGYELFLAMYMKSGKDDKALELRPRLMNKSSAVE